LDAQTLTFLDEPDSAPEPLRSMLAYLKVMTLSPADVDVAPLRAVGLEDADIRDAVYVCALFNLIDRLADTFCFEIPSQEGFDRSARMLVKRGYR
jgi:alkylhydroperoxidase family enzyme